MTEASPKHKALAKHLVSTFSLIDAKTTTVNAYHDEGETTRTYMLCTPDAPDKGIDSYATLTLCEHTLEREDGSPLGFGVELIGIGEGGDDRVADILATCVFNILNDDWLIAPDMIFPGVVGMYNEEGTMQHALFVDPLSGLWPKEVFSFEYEGEKVVFLQMLPISESEYQYALTHSVDALVDKLLDSELAPHDLDREPVV